MPNCNTKLRLQALTTKPIVEGKDLLPLLDNDLFTDNWEPGTEN
jgi:hypothetical protein